jgi:hypothetical protein
MTGSTCLGKIAVLALALGLSDAASAQGKGDGAFGTDVSSECAQMSNPQVKDECVRRLRSGAQIGSERSWQGGVSGDSSSHGVGAGAGAGSGAAMGGLGKGRR